VAIFDGVLRDLRCVGVVGRKCVPIGDEEKTFVLRIVLEVDPVLEGAEVVANGGGGRLGRMPLRILFFFAGTLVASPGIPANVAPAFRRAYDRHQDAAVKGSATKIFAKTSRVILAIPSAAAGVREPTSPIGAQKGRGR